MSNGEFAHHELLSICHNVSKSHLLQRRQKASICGERLILFNLTMDCSFQQHVCEYFISYHHNCLNRDTYDNVLDKYDLALSTFDMYQITHKMFTDKSLQYMVCFTYIYDFLNIDGLIYKGKVIKSDGF